MSKLRQIVFLYALILGQIFLFSQNWRAQDLETRVRISPPAALVEGRFLGQVRTRNFSFLRSYGSFDSLGDRIADVRLRTIGGEPVEHRKLVAGEFLAARDYQSWSYRVDLEPVRGPESMAHVSGLLAEHGVLMPADLLPRFEGTKTIRVAFDLPPGWRVLSVEEALGENIFAVESIDDAVFYVGRGWREKERLVAGTKLKMALAGEWNFTDDQAFAMAGQIFEYYQELFGARPFGEVQIFLARLPAGASFGRWEAETRGASITIFSADMPFSTQSVQKLHEQLRHEIFHLWVPNRLNLAGNYDWFYEGVALYQSLRTALDLNRIRFDDFLDTLGRAYDIDGSQSRRITLLEASQSRWSGSNTRVYARGLLVGFLADLALMQKSKGRRSLAAVLREIYEKHNIAAPREDGNAAILKILEASPELRPVTEKYVRGAEKIDWQTDLEAAGIEIRTENRQTKLAVKARPGGRQKELLDKLGYNNWRKRSELPK